MNKKEIILTDLETIQEWLRIYLLSNNKNEVDQSEVYLTDLYKIFGFKLYKHLKKYNNKEIK